MDSRALGVLDSGVGGLTVVKELLRKLPNEEIIYFGDTLRVPYGNRTDETIIEFSLRIADFFKKQDVKAVVIACHTISAIAAEHIRATCVAPVFSIVDSGTQAACDGSESGHIGVWATEATVNSHVYSGMIPKLSPGALVLQKACPEFVHLAENGVFDSDIATGFARKYSEGMVKRVDSILLACTHFPLLTPSIKRALPGRINLIDPAAKMIDDIGFHLTANGIRRERLRRPFHRFLASGDIEDFSRKCRMILDMDLFCEFKPLSQTYFLEHEVKHAF